MAGGAPDVNNGICEKAGISFWLEDTCFGGWFDSTFYGLSISHRVGLLFMSGAPDFQNVAVETNALENPFLGR